MFHLQKSPTRSPVKYGQIPTFIANNSPESATFVSLLIQLCWTTRTIPNVVKTIINYHQKLPEIAGINKQFPNLHRNPNLASYSIKYLQSKHIKQQKTTMPITHPKEKSSVLPSWINPILDGGLSLGLPNSPAIPFSRPNLGFLGLAAHGGRRCINAQGERHHHRRQGSGTGGQETRLTGSLEPGVKLGWGTPMKNGDLNTFKQQHVGFY